MPLGFTGQWFALGVLTEEGLHDCVEAFDSGPDRNAEHFRYAVFRRSLSQSRPLPTATAEALYGLGVSESAGRLGNALMVDILELPECPASLLDRAAASGNRSLSRVAQRRCLISEARTSPLTPETFERCLKSRNSAVQRPLLDKPELTPTQLQSLAEQGASRAERNLAAEKLKSSR